MMRRYSFAFLSPRWETEKRRKNILLKKCRIVPFIIACWHCWWCFVNVCDDTRGCCRPWSGRTRLCRICMGCDCWRKNKWVKTLWAGGNKCVWAEEAELVERASNEWVGWLLSKVNVLNQPDRWGIAGSVRRGDVVVVWSRRTHTHTHGCSPPAE